MGAAAPHAEEYRFLHEIPTAEEHIHLRTVSGLTPPPTASVAGALKNTVHAVVVRTASAGQAVGMVRVIGDLHLNLLVVDMAVDPAHQRRGLGGKLLDELTAWIDANAPDAYVCLIGDPPGQKLYRSKGFTETLGIGMKRSHWGN